MNKEDKKIINQLKKEQKYEEIFMKYGSKIYRKSIPKKHREKELERLAEERKYEAIYNKYGQRICNKYLIYATYEEMKEVQGDKKAKKWMLKASIIELLASIGIGNIALIPSTILIGGPIVTEITTNINSIIYKEEIQEYEKNISQYAEEIKMLELNDLQTIMKVMQDMWENSQGYATPSKDIIGYMELDLANEDGYGVCRNMASDIAKKLNEINPEYNARILHVKLESGNYECAEIERKYQEKNSYSIEIEENYKEEFNIIEELLGNHIITLVDIPDKNITLAIDPTNPGLGLYKDNKIVMFNSEEVDGLELETREYITILLKGFDGIRNIEDYINCSKNTEITFEELKNEYGIDAQNQALEVARERTFRETLKVEIDSSIIIESQSENENIQVTSEITR